MGHGPSEHTGDEATLIPNTSCPMVGNLFFALGCMILHGIVKEEVD